MWSIVSPGDEKAINVTNSHTNERQQSKFPPHWETVVQTTKEVTTCTSSVLSRHSTAVDILGVQMTLFHLVLFLIHVLSLSCVAFTLPKDLVGIIFDMDGTLIRPCIDFEDMRRRIYEVATEDFGYTVNEGDVVTMKETFSPEGQAKAQNIFNDIEAKALRDMKVMPGMLELCQHLDKKAIRRAVLTRNVATSVDYFYETFMEPIGVPRFDPQVARDTLDENNEVLLAKPCPNGIQHICREWKCDPSQVIMIGDSDQDDIVAGNRAGCGATIHLQTGADNDSGNSNESALEEREPSIVIRELTQLLNLLVEAHSELTEVH